MGHSQDHFPPTNGPQRNSAPSQVLARRRAIEVKAAIDHIERSGGDSVAKVVLYSPEFPEKNPALKQAVIGEIPRSVDVKVLSLDRLGARTTQPGDVVIVETDELTPQELSEVKARLVRNVRQAQYRGLFVGAKQVTPEEISKPYHRSLVPGHYSKAVAKLRPEPIEDEYDPSIAPGEPFPRKDQGAFALPQFHHTRFFKRD